MNIADWKALPEGVLKVFRKFRIISTQTLNGKKIEGYTQARLTRARDAQGKVLGDGPLLAQDVIVNMLKAVIYKEQYHTEWLEWIFVQTGGGQEAFRRAGQAMEQVRDRFIDERVRGYRDTKGQYHNPVTREAAEQKWKDATAKFDEVLQIGDQDMAEKLQVFGFHRHWPGPNSIYQKACSAVRNWLDLTDKSAEMNEFMRRANMKEKQVATKIKEYATVDSLDNSIKKVERFFASRAAREDIRIESVYEDDIVQVIAPLTFSAAVKYGWDAWPFANRGQFEQCLEGSNSWNDPWKEVTEKKKNALVYFVFKVPMPSWVGYQGDHFRRITLHNVCCLIPHGALRRDKDAINTDACEFLDEEGRKVTMIAICEKIGAEATRDCNPEDEEYPIQRGPRVYESQEEADNVIKSIEKAWAAISSWGSGFNTKNIVVDYMKSGS